jgi:hypothetical protein
MRNFIFTLILCITSTSFTIPGQYKRDISDAVQLLKKEQKTIDRIATNYDCKKSEVLSIVFPEIIRYSRFKDFFETKVLEQLYVLKGNAWADFSIGFFQMKPSFVEDLEYHVRYIPGLKTNFREIVEYDATGEESIRFERIERLKNFEWQLKYAFCFYFIMQKCYEAYRFEDDEARLRFFATAYNFGFTKPIAEIEAWMNEKAFPYGKKFKTEQFAFCELSVAFYEHHYSQFEKAP